MVISDAMAALINQQVSNELANRNLYMMFSNWCSLKGLKNLASFFKGEAEGEYTHSEKFREYLDMANVSLVIPAVDKKPSDFADCETIARTYVEAEAETTDKIDKMQDLAFEENDYGTAQFLDWFSGEQIEEMGLTEKFSNAVSLSNGNILLLDLLVGEWK